MNFKGNGAIINLIFIFLLKLSGIRFGLYKSQISNKKYRSLGELFNYSNFIVWVFLIKTVVLMALEMLFQLAISPLKILTKTVISDLWKQNGWDK